MVKKKIPNPLPGLETHDHPVRIPTSYNLALRKIFLPKTDEVGGARQLKITQSNEHRGYANHQHCNIKVKLGWPCTSEWGDNKVIQNYDGETLQKPAI
jgi:hypothetical protein